MSPSMFLIWFLGFSSFGLGLDLGSRQGNTRRKIENVTANKVQTQTKVSLG